ncbi:ADP-ribosylation/Crystallin J1 [Ephemerocybe angulata]|uniref:ADP-ribosylhydrolase ARH3 n=1 Tax=Ephemerocybe angulata TaxID=980116 RepID=A0A8H6IGJ4_9AGAR|nr:ADP-ribosylation/Crystallin J1 [Tulosesus angulatus]
MATRTLSDQLRQKIKLSILGTAMVDALGGPVEFHQRFSFPLMTAFALNSNFASSFGVLKPGTWTDDTSMALCLARSIAKHGFDEGRQLEAYAKWYQKGELSAIDKCFDIGGTTRTALSIYIRSSDAPAFALEGIRKGLSAPQFAGNGSLMRLISVPLVYWRDPEAAKAYARRSSETTHPAPLCMEACELWTGIITMVLQHSVTRSGPETEAPPSPYSKLDLLQFISEYPYENEDLRERLAIPETSTPSFVTVTPGSATGSVDATSREAYFNENHPILRLIAKKRTGASASISASAQRNKNTALDAAYQDPSTHFPFALPAVKDLPSSGYVLHTLVAALYCFFATDTFEAGAIMAVNLGDDADTVGAVYAGLAGCWYAPSSLDGSTSSSSEDSDGQERHLFWSDKVKEWKAGLLKRKLVEQVAEELVQYEKSL